MPCSRGRAFRWAFRLPREKQLLKRTSDVMGDELASGPPPTYRTHVLALTASRSPRWKDLSAFMVEK